MWVFTYPDIENLFPQVSHLLSFWPLCIELIWQVLHLWCFWHWKNVYSSGDEKADPAEIFWKYQLELLKIHIKSVKISWFSPKYWAIFSFLSQVCCLVTPTEFICFEIFSKYFGGIGLLSYSGWNLQSIHQIANLIFLISELVYRWFQA